MRGSKLLALDVPSEGMVRLVRLQTELPTQTSDGSTVWTLVFKHQFDEKPADVQEKLQGDAVLKKATDSKEVTKDTDKQDGQGISSAETLTANAEEDKMNASESFSALASKIANISFAQVMQRLDTNFASTDKSPTGVGKDVAAKDSICQEVDESCSLKASQDITKSFASVLGSQSKQPHLSYMASPPTVITSLTRSNQAEGGSKKLRNTRFCCHVENAGKRLMQETGQLYLTLADKEAIKMQCPYIGACNFAHTLEEMNSACHACGMQGIEIRKDRVCQSRKYGTLEGTSCTRGATCGYAHCAQELEYTKCPYEKECHHVYFDAKEKEYKNKGLHVCRHSHYNEKRANVWKRVLRA